MYPLFSFSLAIIVSIYKYSIPKISLIPLPPRFATDMAAPNALFLFLALFLLPQTIAAAPRAQYHDHQAINEQNLERRTVVPSTTTSSHVSSPTSPAFVVPSLTFITIRAAPTRVTKQLGMRTLFFLFFALEVNDGLLMFFLNLRWNSSIRVT